MSTPGADAVLPVAFGPAAPACAPPVGQDGGGLRPSRARLQLGGRGRVAGPSLAAGALVALSLPPWGWWPLAVAGAALLYWRLAGQPLRTRLFVGWLAGLGCYVPGLFWATSFNWYGGGVLMAVEALAMAAAAALVPARHGRLAAFAGASTLLEAVRTTWPFGGLPLGGVFLGQAQGPLLADARLGGPLLVTLALWGLGGAAGELAMAVGSARHGWGRPSARQALVGGAAAAVVVAVAALAAVAPAGGPPVAHVTVAAVQGGGRRGVSQAQVDPATVFAAQLEATGLVPRSPNGAGPSLVVWPEDVVSVDGSLSGSTAARTLSALARDLRTTLVAGVTVTIPRRRFLNEAVAWGPDGRVVGTYEKVHRVPFGEYVPYRSLFAHLATLSSVPRDAVPGHGTGLLRTPAGPLGLMISYEVFFATRGRSAVRAGARLLVVPTNTSSYATSQVPSQEVAADRVQAVAEGRDLVQAAPTGYSTIVHPDGTVVRRSGLGTQQVVTATVALRDGATVYARTGDGPVLVLAAALAAGGLFAAADRRRRARPVRRAASPHS